MDIWNQRQVFDILVMKSELRILFFLPFLKVREGAGDVSLFAIAGRQKITEFVPQAFNRSDFQWWPDDIDRETNTNKQTKERRFGGRKSLGSHSERSFSSTGFRNSPCNQILYIFNFRARFNSNRRSTTSLTSSKPVVWLESFPFLGSLGSDASVWEVWLLKAWSCGSWIIPRQMISESSSLSKKYTRVPSPLTYKLFSKNLEPFIIVDVSNRLGPLVRM